MTVAAIIDGWPVLLSDTAGLRTPEEEIEEAGVAVAQRQLSAADLVLLVFDGSQTWSESDVELATCWPEAIIVHNKSDLPQSSSNSRPQGLAVSATRGDAIESLLERISKRLVPNVPHSGAAVPFSRSQVDCLRLAKRALESGQSSGALDYLSE